jgi:hypothetical protein
LENKRSGPLVNSRSLVRTSSGESVDFKINFPPADQLVKGISEWSLTVFDCV